MRLLRTTVLMMLVLTVLTGVVYPLAVTGVAQLLFPAQANGNPTLIGMNVEDPKSFWPRPSATPEKPYNGAASSGSNYGPFHPDLAKRIEERRKAFQAADPGNTQPVPIDLLTASASGLDPDISPEGARYQAPRVARLRGLDRAAVDRLIAEATEGRQFGILGEPRVNVQRLNRALDTVKMDRAGTTQSR